MSILEVLQTCPSQRKIFLSTLGLFDPSDTHLIIFDLDDSEPCLPSLVDFQIPIKIRNHPIHRCIIKEGESTCTISKSVWKQLISPELVPSSITIQAYDDLPSQLEGLYQNIPIELGGKSIIIDIEFIDSPLYYNILLGCSYMYSMKAVA